jgi:hypothetical protein
MASLAAKGILSGLAVASLGVAYAGCGGSSGAPRESGAGMTGVGGGGTTGGAGQPGGIGGTAGTGMATGGGGSGGVPVSTDKCSGVGTNALIVDFDEGATISVNNYPIAGGAMPGGTYAYVDPMDATMMTKAAVIDGGHTCKALAFTITSTSWRGVGLWSSGSVTNPAYTGITFWARRGSSSTDPATLKVSIGMDAVTKTGTGAGTCTGTTDAECMRPQTTITLTDSWTEFALYWGAFIAGAATGVPVPASANGVNGIDLAFSSASSGTSTTTEVDLDDVAFLTSAPPASGGTGGMGGAGAAGMGAGGMAGAAGSGVAGQSASGAGGVTAGAGGALAGAGGAAAGGAPAGAGGMTAGAGGASAGAGGASAGAPLGGMAGT